VSKFWSRRRAEAFCEESRKFGITPFVYEADIYCLKKGWKTEEPLTGIVEWLCRLPKPVGIMAPEDNLAFQVIEACKLAELAVPEKVSVLGVHNDPVLCRLSDPPLSSIALNAERAEFQAAQMLDKMMKWQALSTRAIVIEHAIIVIRRSTDFYAISDALVVQAIHFIRSNSDRILQVQEVVQLFAISRRTLEQRFKNSIKRSIYQEIQSNRAKYIANY